MAWTAELLNKTVVDDAILYRVRFTDGTEVHDRDFLEASVDPDEIKRKVKSKLDQFNARATVDAANPKGVITFPTRDSALDTFIQRMKRLRSLLNAASMGVIAADDARIVTIRGQLQTAVAADQTLLERF